MTFLMQADTNNCNYPVLPGLIVLNPDKQPSLVELCSHEGNRYTKARNRTTAPFILSTFAYMNSVTKFLFINHFQTIEIISC